MAWGENGSGQLGDKSTVDSDEPVQVVGKGAKPLTGVISISAGGYEDDEHSLALLSDRSVAAWGNNEYGQLGTGNEADHHTAVKVNGLIWPIKAILAGGRHSLALTTIGTVMAWGWNANGELGDGTTGEQSTEPVEVKELTGIAAISAGESFSIALRSSGTVTSWGWNVSDELGAGLSTEESNVPVEVSGLEGIVGIGAGTEHALAYGP
jgi:alpha-tubulin suppressor-like RCC1 family protein